MAGNAFSRKWKSGSGSKADSSTCTCTVLNRHPAVQTGQPGTVYRSSAACYSLLRVGTISMLQPTGPYLLMTTDYALIPRQPEHHQPTNTITTHTPTHPHEPRLLADKTSCRRRRIKLARPDSICASTFTASLTLTVPNPDFGPQNASPPPIPRVYGVQVREYGVRTGSEIQR